jgi:hypothetical protein
VDDYAFTNPVAPPTTVEEDFNLDEKTRATGFVGAHSERSWLYQLERKARQQEALFSDTSTPNTFRDSISSINYFLDDQELLLDHSVQPFALPPREVADTLVYAFFDTVHPCFPIVGKSVFLHQYHQVFAGTQVKPSDQWLAILNLIFAIATQRLGPKKDGDDWRDPSAYFSRASKLGLAKTFLFHHPGIQQLQIEGLTAFYLFTVGQLNR